MYKIGDKVETPLGIGKLADISQNNETKYKVMHGARSTWYAHDEITPYRTAHEKLIEMGYKRFNTSHGVEYNKEHCQILIDEQDKTYKVYWMVDDMAYWIDLELSRVLTQYLEELE